MGKRKELRVASIDGSPGSRLCAVFVCFCGDSVMSVLPLHTFSVLRIGGVFRGAGGVLLGGGVGRPEKASPAR